jgi:hypothetical protein
MVQRLRSYNVGRLYSVDLKYMAVITNAKKVEKCVKNRLKNTAVIKDNEIYKVNPEILKNIINDCYDKSVSTNEHNILRDEIIQVEGLYEFSKTKNKVPFIIIDK